MTDKKDITVAVTGASGYVAGQVIKCLLDNGYTVRGTVRSVSNKEKVAHLERTFPGLQLFEADLLKEGSFNECFKGCTYVMHTASPFQLQVKDAQKDLVDPALKGTLNVMQSAKDANVKRVVVTSSCAAVSGDNSDPSKVWDESDWNMDSTLTKDPYRYSKRLAEEAAWKFAKENSLEMVAINPSLVVGPPLSNRTDSTSVAIIKGMLDGTTKKCIPLALGLVDVRDVAQAHVVAMEKKEANGNRYICSSQESFSQLEMANWLRGMDEFKEYPIPTEEIAPVTVRYAFSHAKAKKELGIDFNAPQRALEDMARSLKTLGIV